MDFEPFGLYDWLLEFEDHVKHVLGSSGVQSLPLSELGVPPDLLLAGDLGYGPLPAAPALPALVARTYGIPEAQVLATLAGSEADLLAMMAVVKPGDRVVVENPTYPPLQAVPKALGVKVTLHQRTRANGFRLDLGKLEDQLKGAKLLVVSNLNNPTGVSVREDELEELHAIAERRNCHVLVDEAFRELAWEPPPVAATLGDRFLSAHTLTKCYGLAGLRIGWLLGPEEIVAKALTAKKHTSIGLPRVEQALAVAALQQRDRLLQRARALRDANFAMVEPWMQGHGQLTWVRPDGGPICAPRLPDGVDDEAFARRLAEERSVLVAPGSTQGLKGHFRLGFGGDPNHTHPGLQHLDELLAAVAEGTAPGVAARPGSAAGTRRAAGRRAGTGAGADGGADGGGRKAARKPAPKASRKAGGGSRKGRKR